MGLYELDRIKVLEQILFPDGVTLLPVLELEMNFLK